LVFISQLLNLLLFLLSQSIKDLNHLLRGIFDGDVSSHIILPYGFMQSYDNYFELTIF